MICSSFVTRQLGNKRDKLGLDFNESGPLSCIILVSTEREKSGGHDGEIRDKRTGTSEQMTSPSAGILSHSQPCALVLFVNKRHFSSVIILLFMLQWWGLRCSSGG